MLWHTSGYELFVASHQYLLVVSDSHQGKVHQDDRQHFFGPDKLRSSRRIPCTPPISGQVSVESPGIALASQMEKTGHAPPFRPIKLSSSSEVKEEALKFATEIGVPQLVDMVNMMSRHQHLSLHHFWSVCQVAGIPVQFGDELIDTICKHLDNKYFTHAMIKQHWKNLHEICRAAGHELSASHRGQMDWVTARCKLVQDNKVPVSHHLLKELIHAADQVLEKYDATLAKAMFVTAWGGFMWISEYTKVRSLARDHNLATSSINITDDSLGISFISDKTSQALTYLQHRRVRWSFLPTGARLIMEDYKEIHPQAFHFL